MLLVVIQKLSFVNENNLCCICFKKRHLTDKFTCKICNERHSTFLHVSKDPVSHAAINCNKARKTTGQALETAASFASNIQSEEVTCKAISSLRYSTYMTIVRVMLKNTLVVNALLDTASTNNYITKKAKKCLK